MGAMLLHSTPTWVGASVRQRPLRQLRGQKFGQRLPVMGLPAFSQVLRLSFRKTRVVEVETSGVAIVAEFEIRDGVPPRCPISGTPRLDDALILHQLDLASGNVARELPRVAATPFALPVLLPMSTARSKLPAPSLPRPSTPPAPAVLLLPAARARLKMPPSAKAVLLAPMAMATLKAPEVAVALPD